MMGKLAELFVHFATSGVEDLIGKLGEVKGELEKLKAASEKVGQAAKRDLSVLTLVVAGVTRAAPAAAAGLAALVPALKQVREGAEQIAKVATYAFATLTVGVLGFVRAGVGASAVGEVLSFRMGELSRSIAGLFTPEIQRVIDLVQKATSWLRALSNEQRANIVHWVEAAAAALGMAIVMPRVITGIQALVGALVSVLTVGTGGLLPLLGQMASLFVAVGVGGMVAEQQFAPFLELLSALSELLKELAVAFVPVAVSVAEILTPAVRGLTTWLKSLNVETITTAIRMLAAVGAFAAVISIIPKVIAAIKAVITVMKALTLAQIIQKAMSGPAGWAQLALGAAIAAGAIGAAVATFNSLDPDKMAKGAANKAALKGGAGNRGELMPKLGGFESLTAAYDRIAQASVKAGLGKGTPERQLDEAVKTNEKLDKLIGKTDVGHGAYIGAGSDY